ncbi:hypothetical protein FIV36_07235 [Pseudomonas extremaustralis]|uniref:Uncharacterized protein n=1 Tax=Pseudomonas extremaustralis TaxID=359110 RepID=A0A5C5QK77_9PSED|nr:hypothetical protein FIV36_07235 [Pseudomonas extremaustralis]
MCGIQSYVPVGASLLAKNVNDNAGIQHASSALGFFASKLAPTVIISWGKVLEWATTAETAHRPTARPRRSRCRPGLPRRAG